MVTNNTVSVLLTFILCTTGWATIIHVPIDQPTIQAGIDSAANGDTVMVAPDTYYENINFREKGIVVASHFITNSNYAYIDSTIIDGSAPLDPDTASCVLMVSDSSITTEDTSAALIGFTLTNGTGTKWTDEHGAGVYREGGGIIVQYWSPRIYYNKIVDNEALDTQGVTSAGGGAIRCGDGNPRIMNNVIAKNAALYGGGVVLNFTGAIIRNNVIAFDSAGSAYGGGGAIWAVSNGTHDKIIENNTIVYNKVGYSSYGGGFRLWSTNATIRNNIIWGNEGQQIYRTGGAVLVTYSDVQGGWTGEGNIDTIPYFTTDNFYLSDSSPCIDAGDTNALYNDPEDPGNPGSALWPAMGTVRNDMGAYGGPYSSLLPDVPTDVRENTTVTKPRRIRMTAYPNPFTKNVNIAVQFSSVIAPTQPMTVNIYDITGQLIRSFQITSAKFSLPTVIVWDGTDNSGKRVNAGVYMCVLNTDNTTMSTKILLLE